MANVQIEQLRFGYKRSRPMFQDLSLTLEPGHVYGLLGRNGAGKSSLLRLMGGLLFPQEGYCRVGDFRAAERHPDFLREVFYIPEEFDLPHMRISDYVRVNAPFYPRFDREQFERYLDEFELVSHLRMTELSFGQKKKVFTGFGLAANTTLLLLDEPTNGLDIPSKTQFRRLIAQVVDPERVIVVSTHQVRDLEGLIDPVIILENSKVLLHEPMERIHEKLWFTTVPTLEQAPAPPLYHEPSLRGIAAVLPNPEGRHSKPDLELLFNAVLKNPDTIAALFAQPSLTPA
ncbi:MAG: ABC transporter ATP-binding protein [Saprospiraceae bacterium]|nr:ABC transporter ATP-binding protein [Saprospiraceae bacterium]